MPHITPQTFYDSQIGMLLGRSAILKDRLLDKHLEAYGLTAAQFKVLIIMARWNVDTPAELCRHLALDSGSMTRMLGRLEQKQLIVRRRSDTDRRQVHIVLAAAGQALAQRFPHIGAAAMNEFVGVLESSELTELERILSKILTHAGDRAVCWSPGDIDK
ncbi:MarR family winged helix-turn-helix transcriptional regulator [Pseudomonas typographi]|uniref:MarR family transcriptional regulator n=1 Tax=Pseudomonas typographi TaxID=2715964 RepID=A0ABR7Z2D0_9PSED|nr:MarR family transcriptional regulator [Pseudomonas typographi]MBD1587249.1 MarR family transcriptional regulator [Pseudomonas typographi]MBD1599564.1 MarR family transcriptional regulator [Pseudomonas typographi]